MGPCSARGSFWTRRSRTVSWSAAALRGLRISWERPAVIVPTAASFSAMAARRASSRFSEWSRTCRMAVSSVMMSSGGLTGFWR
jgi:hypothetical protein